MAAKVTKLTDDTVGAFTETRKHAVLACGNIEGNNNKFYSIELQKDPGAGKYRLFTHYGRINSSNVYEMRGPWASEYEAELEFDAIVKKKLRGKNIKEEDGTTRREKYEKLELVSPTVGSPNVRGKTVETISSQISVKQVVQGASRFDKDVQRLLDQFAQENIHKITSLSSVAFTANGFETALGPVTQNTINQAREALNNLKSIMSYDGEIDPHNGITLENNNKYYSLIPHAFGRKITRNDWIITDGKLFEEYDLLDQLEASVKLGMTTNTNASKQFSGFETDIEPVDKKDKTYKILVDEVETTKKHDHLKRYKVKNVYTVTIGKERKRFDNACEKYGNISEYFHGSQNANLLSILLGGLIIPPVSAGHVTGRMFGNGIYGANSSTKSLNYSVGGWSGKRNTYNNAFLLRVKFAMGKTYEIGNSLYSGPPKGYDSVSAYARLGRLYNDEFIVYSLDQCTITHLIELE